MLPLVSIVVRSMARASLHEALASIGMQDYARIEAVVVAACGDAHPVPPRTIGNHGVRFVAGESPRSRPQAANAGLDAATGEWITFLDDDDVLLPAHVSGLVEALGHAGTCNIVYTLACARFADGTTQPVGQPFAPIELFERNFIQLSMALFSRELLAQGCRFDESLEILQDWDFFIQCAQHTHFHFEPRQTFEWRAEAGDSGAGAGVNQDDARFAAFRDRIYAKWAPRHDALVERVGDGLRRAAELARARDFAGAEAICREVLDFSQNDPFALNLLAMLQRAAGNIDDARKTQALACAVRPHDASLARNLTLLNPAPAAATAGPKPGGSSHVQPT
ncbi:MAG TPA: glycosyltransferase [Casimicrobiaceae bacterium]|nr:glycosyltransferase [Casimicrobiaceae bacterium]